MKNLKKAIVMFLVCTLSILPLNFVCSAEENVPLTFYPTADTYVRGAGSAATPNGDSETLHMQYGTGSSSRTAYMTFSGMTYDANKVEKAELKLYVSEISSSSNATTGSINVYGLTDTNRNSWTEGDLTYDTASILGLLSANTTEAKIATVDVTAETWCTIDVTDYVKMQNDNILGFMITGGSGDVVLVASKEKGTNKPCLSVTISKGEKLTLGASDDTGIRGVVGASTIHGTNSQVYVQGGSGSNYRTGFMRFEGTCFDAFNPSKVELCFKTDSTNNSDTPNLSIYKLVGANKTAWDETTLTYNTANENGMNLLTANIADNLLATIVAVEKETWYKVDITDYAKGQTDDILGFMFTIDGTNPTGIYSKESANAPYIIATFDDEIDYEQVSYNLLDKAVANNESSGAALNKYVTYGMSTTWQSSNTELVSNEGIVTRHNLPVSTVSVDLTGTITVNGTSYTKTYSIDVLKEGIRPNVDAYVRAGGHVEINYSDGAEMIVHGNTGAHRIGFIRFDMTAREVGTAGKFVLRFKTGNLPTGAETLYVTGVSHDDKDNCAENEITFNNSANLITGGTAIKTITGIAAETWYDVDITEYAKAQNDGVLLIRFETAETDDPINIYTKESDYASELIVSQPYYTITKPAFYYGASTDAATSVQTGTATAKSVIENKGNYALGFKIVTALYDKTTDSLVDVKISDVTTIDAGETGSVAQEITVPNEGNYILKAFVWDFEYGLVPLVENGVLGE